MKYVIQMSNGLFFSDFENGQIKTTLLAGSEETAKYPTRFAALQQCAQSHEFAGAMIQPYQEVPQW